MKSINATKTILLIIILTLSIKSIAATADWLMQSAYKADQIEVDQSADVLVLHNSMDVIYNETQVAVKHIRVAYKILSVAGKKYATLSEYVTQSRMINSISGWLISPEGQVTELSDPDIKELGIKTVINYYDSGRILIAEFQNVEPGAIVAFEYIIEESGLGSSYQKFEFQKDQPVKFAQFTVDLPDNWSMFKKEFDLEGINYNKKGNQHIWTARNLAYKYHEPHMPPSQKFKQIYTSMYAPNIQFANHFSEWRAVSRWLTGLFDQPTQSDKTITDKVKKITAGLLTKQEKINAIANFVRDEVRYVAIEIGDGRWHPRPAYSTLLNRYGDCKDKAALMLAVLNVLEIPAVPVFTNTHDLIHTELPTPFQFNHCFVGIPLGNLKTDKVNSELSEWLFFDPTDPTLTPGKIPVDLQGKTVMIAGNDRSHFFTIPNSLSENFFRNHQAEAHLNLDGSFSARIKITDYGNLAAKLSYQNNIKPIKKQIEDWSQYIAETVPSATLSDFATGNEGDSVWVTFKIESDRYTMNAGSMQFFRPNLFTFADLPVLNIYSRELPIWLGHAKQINTAITWYMPAGWNLESKDVIVKNSCDIASISCETISDKNKLRFQSVLSYTGDTLPAAQFNKVKNFNNSLQEIKNITIILNGLERL